MTNENPELEKTQKFYPPLEEIIAKVEQKEAEMIQGVKDSLEGTLQMPVEILDMKYIGDGKYEVTFSLSTNGGTEEKKVIAKGLEPLSE